MNTPTSSTQIGDVKAIKDEKGRVTLVIPGRMDQMAVQEWKDKNRKELEKFKRK